MNKNKEIIVLNHKRSNAINIGMTKLPPPRSIKTAILKMDATIMNREGIEVRIQHVFLFLLFYFVFLLFSKIYEKSSKLKRIKKYFLYLARKNSEKKNTSNVCFDSFDTIQFSNEIEIIQKLSQ